MPTKKFAYDDYVLLPDDGQRYEVLDGEVVVSPAAGTPHQGLQAELMTELMLRIGRKRRGKVFTDVDCELGKHDIVRPDLIVVLPAHYEHPADASVRHPGPRDRDPVEEHRRARPQPEAPALPGRRHQGAVARRRRRTHGYAVCARRQQVRLAPYRHHVAAPRDPARRRGAVRRALVTRRRFWPSL